jgi:hypothetical protein
MMPGPRGGTSLCGVAAHGASSTIPEVQMVFAADYPFLDILWTMLIFFAWVIWFWILIKVIADIFRRRDVGGGKKTIWMIFVILLPFIGVFSYLLANGSQMTERDFKDAERHQAQFDSYVRSVARDGSGGGGSAATEISNAKKLLDDGAITQAEFDQLKARALAGGTQ